MTGMFNLLGTLPAFARRSVTFDRGTEFARDPVLKSRLGMDACFCKPQAPWQKRLRRVFQRQDPALSLYDTDIGGISEAVLQKRSRLLHFGLTKTFDKLQKGKQAAIVENKCLSVVLAYVAERQRERTETCSAKAPRRRGQAECHISSCTELRRHDRLLGLARDASWTGEAQTSLISRALVSASMRFHGTPVSAL